MVTGPTIPDDYYDERDRAMSDTTNDERAGYGKAAQVRATVKAVVDADAKAATAPLLSDADIVEWRDRDHWPLGAATGATHVRNFYESQIASGELMVVKTVKLDENGWCPQCGFACGWLMQNQGQAVVSCPGCSAKIIEG